MMKNLNLTESKIGQAKLEVLRFNSADVIATSVFAPVLTLDANEMIATPGPQIFNDPNSFKGPGSLQ